MEGGLGVAELVILVTAAIGSVAAAIVTIVNGVRVKVTAERTTSTLEGIRTQTNGHLSELTTELQRTHARVQALEALLVTAARAGGDVPSPH